VDSAQGRNLAPFVGDLSQNEKLSEIKPPLYTMYFHKFHVQKMNGKGEGRDKELPILR
jgi:hypothetical protein